MINTNHNENITAYYEDKSLLLFAALMSIGLIGTLFLFDADTHDLRLFIAPLLLIYAPFQYWWDKRKKKQRELDKFVLCNKGVFLTHKNRDNFIAWDEIDEVGYSKLRFQISIWFISKNSKTELFIRLADFDIDQAQVIDFIQAKKKEHQFKFNKLDFFAQKRNL